MLSTLVVAVVWLFVSVEWVLGASVVVSDTELVLSDCCVVVVWLVTSVECVSGVSVDTSEVSVVVVVVVVIETELVVSLGPCVVVLWFGAFVKMVLVASVDSVEVCVVVSGAELFVAVVGASVDVVLSTPSLVEFVPLFGFSVVIVSDVVVVSVSSVVFTVVVGIATLVEVVSDVIVFVVLCVSGVGVVSELFVVVVIVVVDKLVVDCDVPPGCVVVSSVDPLCNVVVAAVVSFPEGDVASLEDCVDGASVTFSVVCVNWGDVVVIDASVVEDKLDTSTTADIITDTCRQMYSYLVNLVFKDILKDTQYSFRMSQLKSPF